MKRHASSCIDTSDGVWAALNTLADLNGCGYAVAGLPYIHHGEQAARAGGWPRTLLFLGECGEYELLFTVRPKREPLLLAEAKLSHCTFYRLGTITRTGRSLVEEGRQLDLGSLRLQARDYETPRHYLEVLTRWLARPTDRGKGPRRASRG